MFTTRELYGALTSKCQKRRKERRWALAAAEMNVFQFIAQLKSSYDFSWKGGSWVWTEKWNNILGLGTWRHHHGGLSRQSNTLSTHIIIRFVHKLSPRDCSLAKAAQLASSSASFTSRPYGCWPHFLVKSNWRVETACSFPGRPDLK